MVGNGNIPATHEERGNRLDVWRKAVGDAALKACVIGIGCGQCVGAVEEQRHIYRDPGVDRRADRRQPLGRAGNLDEDVGAINLRVELLRLGDSRVGVVGQLGRYLERNETVEVVGPGVNVAEEVGGALKVRDCGLKKDLLIGHIAAVEAMNLLVIGVAAGDRLLEDRRV